MHLEKEVNQLTDAKNLITIHKIGILSIYWYFTMTTEEVKRMYADWIPREVTQHIDEFGFDGLAIRELNNLTPIDGEYQMFDWGDNGSMHGYTNTFTYNDNTSERLTFGNTKEYTYVYTDFGGACQDKVAESFVRI
jgi:hypothetical protein